MNQIFATEFPDYAALSKPSRLTSKEMRVLLAHDEALVLFAAGDEDNSFVFALTRDSFDWKSIPLDTDKLATIVSTVRRELDVDMVASPDVLDATKKKRELFDLGVASEAYNRLLGPVDTLIRSKRHLLVGPFGPLTGLPFHLPVSRT